jgi:predicted nuclease of predicted toxin-antitoxin system
MKLLLDMNLSQLWLAPLREAGFEVLHWISIGDAFSDDAEIMHYAQEHDYTICTQDLDFGLMLARSGHGRPSVVQIRAQDVLPKDIGPQVISALLRMERELEAGALVTVDPRKTRVRVLPLRVRD